MKKKKSTVSLIALIAIFLVTAVLSYAGLYGLPIGTDYRMKSFGQTIIRGLDLQGGTSVLLEIQEKDVKAEDLERVRELLNMRVNSTGATDATLITEGTNRIRVDIPGKYETKNIVDMLSQTGKLTFKDPSGNVVLEGKDVADASVVFDEYDKPAVALTFNDEGAKKFADVTSKNIGKQISISMDNKVLSSPTVNSVIDQGKATITGSFTLDEAKNLAAMIKNGALPVEIKPVSVRNIGATLGSSVLPNVKTAGLISIGLIFAIMLFFYRRPGAVASLALSIFILLLLYFTYAYKISMSLAGIAGFLLSVGMAVDANVLIFERTKEELRKGLDIFTSIKAGFSNAMSSIVDANITTIISGVILYYVGSGTVRGFAMNLIIGVVISMLTAVIITRILMFLAYRAGLLTKPSHFGVTDKPEREFKFPFYKHRWKFFAGSLALFAVGLVFFFVKGPNVGIDFKGGTQVMLNFESTQINKPEIDQLLQSKDPDVVSLVVEDKMLEIRSQKLTTADFDPIIKDIKTKYSIESANFVDSVNEIGSSIGSEQTRKAIFATLLSTLAILAYVAVRFKWTLGVGAIVALIHDVLFMLTMYVIFQFPINSPFIAAILTIIGYSINDTVVIFDRIRENLRLKGNKHLEQVTDSSISQTMVRTINTSLTVFVVILLLYIFVPQIRDFSLPLLLGTLSGAYSTIFIASPIYVMLEKKYNPELVKLASVDEKTVNKGKAETVNAKIEGSETAESTKRETVKKAKRTEKENFARKYKELARKKKAALDSEAEPVVEKVITTTTNTTKKAEENITSEVTDATVTKTEE